MGLGFLEIVIIGVAAFVLLGPERIPEVMRQFAKFYVQMRRTSNDFKSAFDHVVREAEAEIRSDEITDLRKSLKNIPETIKTRIDDGIINSSPVPRSQTPVSWDQSVQPPLEAATVSLSKSSTDHPQPNISQSNEALGNDPK